MENQTNYKMDKFSINIINNKALDFILNIKGEKQNRY